MTAVKVLIAAIAACVLLSLSSCYPKTCASTDTSCWPCENPANTNPACPPFPSDTKRPTDGGSDGSQR
jgi:hypothetical protein